MSLQPYPAYKDAGVEWLGEVPEHWKISRLKDVAAISLSNVDKHSLEGQQSVLLCNYLDVYRNESIHSSMEFMVATAPEEQIHRLSLKPGDVIITKDSEAPDDIGIPTLVENSLPNLVCGYHLALLRSNKKRMLGSFLFRYLQSGSTKAAFFVEAKGITRFALGKQEIAETCVLTPPTLEQQSIADFLDKKTSAIDALIEKKKRQIELLQEKRSTLITHAVTKGLNPEAKMKDSGVEWLRDIPEQWDLVRLKFLTASPLAYGANEAALEDDQSFPRFVRITDVGSEGNLKEETFKSLHPNTARPYMLKGGDLLLARSGATVGKTFLYKPSWGAACFAGYLIRCQCNLKMIIPDFLYAFTQSDLYWQQIRCNTIQSTIQNFSAEKYANIWVPLPPMSEQIKIINTLSREVKALKENQQLAERSITLLREYRSALITAAVTGKIDVREGIA